MFVRNLHWPEDRDALLRHIQLAHGVSEYDVLAAWYGSVPGFDPQDCFVIEGEDEGEIIAHAMIVPRQLQIGVSVLPAAEVGMVGVQESYRRQGLAHTLVDQVHQRMTERGDALGLIFGIPHFYEHWHYDYAVGLYLTSYEPDITLDLALRAGHWNSQHSYERRTADRLRVRSRPVIVRRFYLDDLPAVQALYAAESVQGHYLIARDEATWTWQLEYMTRIGRNDPDDFLVAEIDDRVVAYVRLVTQEPVNWFRDSDAARLSVIEAAGSEPDALEALLGTIAQTAQAFNVDRIGLFVHPQGAFMRHALARGAALRDFTGAGFVRLHDLSLALDLLVPTFEARRLASCYATRAYHLIVRSEHDQGEVYLGMGDAEDVVLEAPSTTLARLITGWYGIEHVENGYAERYANLLGVLFPRRDPKIGLADLT